MVVDKQNDRMVIRLNQEAPSISAVLSQSVIQLRSKLVWQFCAGGDVDRDGR